MNEKCGSGRKKCGAKPMGKGKHSGPSFGIVRHSAIHNCRNFFGKPPVPSGWSKVGRGRRHSFFDLFRLTSETSANPPAAKPPPCVRQAGANARATTPTAKDPFNSREMRTTAFRIGCERTCSISRLRSSSCLLIGPARPGRRAFRHQLLTNANSTASVPAVSRI